MLSHYLLHKRGIRTRNRRKPRHLLRFDCSDRLDRLFPRILILFLLEVFSGSNDILEVAEVSDLISEVFFVQVIFRFHEDFFAFFFLRGNISSELPSIVAKNGSGILIVFGIPSIKFEPKISESIVIWEGNSWESIVCGDLYSKRKL